MTSPSPTAAVSPASRSLEGFHPAVRAWFERRFPDGPTEAQTGGWPAIVAGAHTLICAPTGSGKTLAGFLAAIDALYHAHEAGESIEGATQVVYLSPLKALAVDVHTNLEEPLAEIAEVARELGYEPAPITVAVRTGDSTSYERQMMVRRPPNLLVTTPESLYLYLTAERSRATLETVETVIVDEIHALARDKRGSHLTLSLERLQAVTERPPVRIGLSATVRPLETAARLLVGADEPLPDRRRQRAPAPPRAVAGAARRRARGRHLRRSVQRDRRPHRRPRRQPPDHAGLRQHQEAVRAGGPRAGRAAGRGPGGRPSRVAVARSPPAGRAPPAGRRPARARRHRLAGARHRHRARSSSCARSARPTASAPSSSAWAGPTTTAPVFPGESCTRPRGTSWSSAPRCLPAVERGRLDALHPPEQPLDILAQQIVAETAARGDDGVAEDELFDLVTRAWPYRRLTREEFEEIVDLVSTGIETGRGRRMAYLHRDRVNGRLRGRRGARLATLTSGGAIPETGDYRVLMEPGDVFIGTVNEDFAIESFQGDVFLLGTHPWQIVQVTNGVLRVRDATGRHPTIPFWVGEAPGRTDELSEEVSRLRSAVAERLDAGGREAAIALVQEVSGVDAVAAALVVDYLHAGRAALGGVLPTHDDIVFERFFDESGGMQLIVHAPLGARINRALGLGLRKKFCLNFDFELQAAASNDAALLSLGPAALVPARGRARLPSLPQRAGRRLPGGAPQPDVHRPLALEPQPVARRAAPQGRPAQPVQHPAHGGGRPDGRRVPGPRRLPGQRPGRPDRDPRSPARARDDGRLPQRGHGHRRPQGARRAASRKEPFASTSSTPSSRACWPTRSSTARPSRTSTRTPRSASAGRARCRCAGACRSSRASWAGSTPTRSSGCGPRRPRRCATPTSSTTCSCRLVAARPRQEWAEQFETLASAGRVFEVHRPGSTDVLWAATERRAEVEALFPGARFVPDHPLPPGLPAALDAEAADEAAVTLVRGHLDVSGPVTVDDLAVDHRPVAVLGDHRARGPAGTRVRGERAVRARARASSGAPAGCWPASTATPASGGGPRSVPSARRSGRTSSSPGGTPLPGPGARAGPVWQR